MADIYNDDYLLGKAIEFKLSARIDRQRAGLWANCNAIILPSPQRAGVKIAFGTDAGVYPARRERQTILLTW